MKRAIALFAFVLGCSATQRAQEKQVLDLTQILCIDANLELPSPAVATACAIDQAAVPVIDQILSERRSARLTAIVHAREVPCPCASAASSAK